MVSWKRKIQIQNDQARLTLPKRWIDSLGLEDKDEVEVKEMKRESALKIIPKDE